MTKNSFVLQTRLKAVFAKLSDKQAGVLIKSIFDYADTGAVANFEDGMVGVVFEMVKQDLDYAAKKYAETCARRAESGKLGGLAKVANASKCYQTLAKPSKAKHIDNDVVVDVDNDVDINKKLNTAPKAAEQVSKPKRELTTIQQFSNRLLANFEPDLDKNDKAKVGVWYRTNCRYFSEILKYCHNDLDLAEGCVYACVTKLEKNGLSGGYAAVVRHLPEYHAEALKILGGKR